ncbi:MAG TPA: (2Fe-2S)-binding protein [Phaeodactylibacter sp.]|nr:(2Fe-2S)-binding protein [Phaeodactylibacter sp.]
MKVNFSINKKAHSLDLEGDTPLLWVIRDVLGLKGTKFGCGKAACGACTVLIEGKQFRSCAYPVKFAEDKDITTIEGLASNGNLHPVQQAWMEEVVPQCGYCQPGFMMATTALLQANPQPSDEDIDQNIVNVCRCGTYYRIRKAIHRAAEIMNHQNNES